MASILDWEVVESSIRNTGEPDRSRAFSICATQGILKVDQDEAEDSITDGASDLGVDAVHVETTEGHAIITIVQFKCVKEYAQSKKNFPSGEIDKPLGYIHRLLDKDQSLKRDCNTILWSKTQEIWDSISGKRPRFRLIFCGNMGPLVENELARAKESVAKYNSFDVESVDLDKITSLLRSKESVKLDRAIRIVDKDYFDRTDGNVRGLICSVSADELVKVISKEEDPSSIEDALFDENIRVYLTSNNRINKKIIDSALSGDRSLFWYLNNGITVVCDRFSYEKTRSPDAFIEGMQIVNGGQTSHSLFEAHKINPDGFDDILVLVRIVETSSKEIALKVAESTNSQTPIKGRDLHSNDDVQRRLQSAFEGSGYFYERKYNQFKEMQKDRRIDAVLAGQLITAYELGNPETARKDKAKIFGDFYDRTFTDELTPNMIITPFEMMRIIQAEKRLLQEKIRKDETYDPEKIILLDGSFHILYAISEICDQFGIDKYNVNNPEEILEFALQAVNLCIDDEEAKESDDSYYFSYSKFFKESRAKKLIAEKIKTIKHINDGSFSAFTKVTAQ